MLMHQQSASAAQVPGSWVLARTQAWGVAAALQTWPSRLSRLRVRCAYWPSGRQASASLGQGNEAYLASRSAGLSKMAAAVGKSGSFQPPQRTATNRTPAR
ncbi:MAG: hypothetical protein QOI66_3499 [Myxococcales bacterium]|nr:hypothetical protein [Myxococcales bacterium]